MVFTKTIVACIGNKCGKFQHHYLTNVVLALFLVRTVRVLQNVREAPFVQLGSFWHVEKNSCLLTQE